MTRRPPPKKTGRAARVVLLGVIAVLVLGISFMAGAATRRWWWPAREAPWAVTSGWKHWLGIAPRKSTAEVGAKEKPRSEPAPPAGPVLTFYHELTAPLVPAPPPPRPKPGGGPVVVPMAPSTAPGATALGSDRDAAAPGGRFTVQVGAYRTREGAESLRTKLAGIGFEVFIVESALPDGVRYRVQVGSFPTAEEARTAAAKLAGTRQVATYVTTR